LHFFGLYEESDIDKIPDYSINVPIELCNKFTNETKKLKVFAKFVSSSSKNGKTGAQMYKPDIGICIFHPAIQV
jgi:hypothetical protein